MAVAVAEAADTEVLSWVNAVCGLHARDLYSLSCWGFLDEKKGYSGKAHLVQTHAGRAQAAWEISLCLHRSGLQRLHVASVQGKGVLKHIKLLCLGIGRGVACMKSGLLK